MIDIFNLALPYFGLIFIGFACGRSKGLPEAGFAMDELLSALCFAARAAVWNHVENAVRGTQHPPFLIATTLGTMSAFVLALSAGRIIGQLSF
jgi:malonate transporter and related proteins